MPRIKKDSESKENFEYLDASYVIDRPKKVVKVSPAIDIVLSGGWPEGTVGILEAFSKVGKTTFALKVAAKAQQQFNKLVVYVSVENRLSEKNLKGVEGLDISSDKFKIIASTENNILTTEQVLLSAEKALVDFPGCVMIFDSLSALSSADEQNKGYGEGYAGMDSRKLEGQFMRRISGKVLINNIIFIGIAHLTKKINGMGSSPKIADATLFAHDIRLLMKRHYDKSNPTGEWVSGDKVIGQKIEVTCLTSALGRPYDKCLCWLKYGSGFSDESELAQLASDLSVIEKKGAGWYVAEKHGIKEQGMENLSQFLKDNPKIYSNVLKEVQELLDES